MREWKETWKSFLERLPIIEVIRPKGIKKDENLCFKLSALAKEQEKTERELMVIPVTDEVIYSYDYSDGWEVSIKLTDCYYTITRVDVVKNGGVPIILDDERALAEMRSYNMQNKKMDKDLALKIARTYVYEKPECISADGLNVLDDCGGIHGFVDMLRQIHGNDPDEKEEMREWARSMGWTGRMRKVEKIL